MERRRRKSRVTEKWKERKSKEGRKREKEKVKKKERKRESRRKKEKERAEEVLRNTTVLSSIQVEYHRVQKFSFTH